MEALTFSRPLFLLALVLAVAAGLGQLYLLRWQRRALARFGGPSRGRFLWVFRSEARWGLKGALLMMALALVGFALGGPQLGHEATPISRQGIDLLLALDVSTSMAAQDVPPSRLEVAKRALGRLLDRLREDRVGVVLFAGGGQLRFPLTTDLGAAKALLAHLYGGALLSQGTAIGEAIREGMRAFGSEPGSPGRPGRTRVLVIVSDGEDQGSEPLGAAREAAERGATIFTLGVGTREGGPIPLRGAKGESQGFKKDASGQTVHTALDEATLRQIAAASGGAYYRLSPNAVEVDQLLTDLARLQRMEIATESLHRPIERYPLFALAAFALLVVESFLSTRAVPRSPEGSP